MPTAIFNPKTLLKIEVKVSKGPSNRIYEITVGTFELEGTVTTEDRFKWKRLFTEPIPVTIHPVNGVLWNCRARRTDSSSPTAKWLSCSRLLSRTDGPIKNGEKTTELKMTGVGGVVITIKWFYTV